MLKIRLSRVGKSHTPIYRLVVAEKSRAVKRENIEILGLYNPANKADKFQVKKDRVLHWIGLGAQPSDTARNLLCDFDVLPKKAKIKIVHGKAGKKKDKKESTTQNKTQMIADENPIEAKSEESVPEKDATSEVIEKSDNKEETTQIVNMEEAQK
jgi:small subunit ribosomal protein S16